MDRTILTAAMLAGTALTGCVTEPQLPQLFHWPDDLDSALMVGNYMHNVELVFEIDPREDLPEGMDFGTAVLPQIHGNREVYRVLDIHEVVYASQEFEVGGFRYPAPLAGRRPGGSGELQERPRRSAVLYVFKERIGDMEFAYRGQTVVVRAKGRWVPSIYFVRERGRDWQTERVQVGLSTIETSSRSRHWTVDGKAFRPDPDRPLILRGAVTFEGR